MTFGPGWHRSVQLDFVKGIGGRVETVTKKNCELSSFAGRLWRGRLAPQAIIWGGIFIALVMVSLCATVLYQSRLV